MRDAITGPGRGREVAGRPAARCRHVDDGRCQGIVGRLRRWCWELVGRLRRGWPDVVGGLRGTCRDAGMATAEYAMVTLAAVGFAGLLALVLRSDEVRGLLTGLVRRALDQ